MEAGGIRGHRQARRGEQDRETGQIADHQDTGEQSVNGHGNLREVGGPDHSRGGPDEAGWLDAMLVDPVVAQVTQCGAGNLREQLLECRHGDGASDQIEGAW